MKNTKEAKVRALIKKLELELIPYFPNDDLLVKEHVKLAVKELEIVEEEKNSSGGLCKTIKHI